MASEPIEHPQTASELNSPAVAAGERSVGAKYFEENKGHFWGVLETRSYKRTTERALLLRKLPEHPRNRDLS